MSDDNQVFIVYKDQEEVFDIEDLDPDLLKQFFELDFTPLTLKHEKSKKNIVIKKKGKLIAGTVLWIYIISYLVKNNYSNYFFT